MAASRDACVEKSRVARASRLMLSPRRCLPNWQWYRSCKLDNTKLYFLEGDDYVGDIIPSATYSRRRVSSFQGSLLGKFCRPRLPHSQLSQRCRRLNALSDTPSQTEAMQWAQYSVRHGHLRHIYLQTIDLLSLTPVSHRKAPLSGDGPPLLWNAVTQTWVCLTHVTQVRTHSNTSKTPSLPSSLAPRTVSEMDAGSGYLATRIGLLQNGADSKTQHKTSGQRRRRHPKRPKTPVELKNMHSQSQSDLCSYLPGEIRNIIWQHVFGKVAVEIVQRKRGLAHIPLDIHCKPSSQEYTRLCGTDCEIQSCKSEYDYAIILRMLTSFVTETNINLIVPYEQSRRFLNCSVVFRDPIHGPSVTMNEIEISSSCACSLTRQRLDGAHDTCLPCSSSESATMVWTLPQAQAKRYRNHGDRGIFFYTNTSEYLMHLRDKRKHRGKRTTLLYACKKIAAEAITALYTTTDFVFSDRETLERFVERVHPKHLSTIRHVSLSFDQYRAFWDVSRSARLVKMAMQGLQSMHFTLMAEICNKDLRKTDFIIDDVVDCAYYVRVDVILPISPDETLCDHLFLQDTPPKASVDMTEQHEQRLSIQYRQDETENNDTAPEPVILETRRIGRRVMCGPGLMRDVVRTRRCVY